MSITDTTKKAIAGIAERAGSTFVQAFIVGWLALDKVDASGLQIVAVGAVAAALAVVKGMVQARWFPPGSTTTFAADLANRVIFTFAEVFVAVLVVSPGQVSTWQGAWTAAIAAALAVVKSGLAARFGKDNAAMLPAALDPTPPYI